MVEVIFSVYREWAWPDILALFVVTSPSIIAAISSMRNGRKIDKTVLQTNIQHALDQIREKSNGENFGASPGSQKETWKSSKKKTLRGDSSE